MNKPHIHYAHRYWKNFLQKGDFVIDATCGNGHDTLVLAKAVLTSNAGKVMGLDIQEKALNNTKLLLEKELSAPLLKRVDLQKKSHDLLHELTVIPKLIVYNLGYLPGSDKSITTKVATTLESIAQALTCVKGAISITCYPGHEEGRKEEKALFDYLHSLDSLQWSISYHQWICRPLSPTLFWIKNISI